jgi:hypothetical protein
MTEKTESPNPSEPIRASWVVWPLVVHGGVALGLLIVLTVVLPRFLEIFRSFGTALPTATVLALRASALVQRSAVVLIPCVAGFLMMDVWLYVHLRREGRDELAAVLFWALTLLGLAAIFVVVFAVILPLNQLSHAVQNSAASGG